MENQNVSFPLETFRLMLGLNPKRPAGAQGEHQNNSAKSCHSKQVKDNVVEFHSRKAKEEKVDVPFQTDAVNSKEFKGLMRWHLSENGILVCSWPGLNEPSKARDGDDDFPDFPNAA